jgi:hypothetical protein
MKIFEKNKFEESLLGALKDMFNCSIEEKDNELHLNMDKKMVTINLKNNAVKCEEVPILVNCSSSFRNGSWMA